MFVERIVVIEGTVNLQYLIFALQVQGLQTIKHERSVFFGIAALA